MRWFYVAYNILDESSGQPVGNGTITITLDHTPRTIDEIHRLSDRVTEICRSDEMSSQRFGENRYVQVAAWSEMGS